MREPGSALELIDRYLLRTLNLQALPGGAGRQAARIAVIIEFAEFVVPRGDAAAARRPVRRQHGQGPRLGQRPRDRPVEHRHRAPQRGAPRPQRARRREPARGALHIPLPNEAEMTAYVTALATTQFPDLPAKSDVPIETLAAR